MDYSREEIKNCFKKLNSSKKGLSKVESNNRIKKYGFNEIVNKNKINYFKMFFEQFKSFIIYILLFAVIISFLLAEYVDAIIILIILFLNAIIGFVQEIKAQKSIESLKKLNKTITKVYRDSKLINIDSKFLVPGDIVYLEAGDRVPTDLRIIESARLKIEESSITGESLPVSKNNLKLNVESGIGDKKNILYSSSSVSQGTVLGIVINTGLNTQIGKISKSLMNVDKKLTPLQIKLESFGKKLGLAVIFICIIIFVISFIKEFLTNGISFKSILDLALIAVALAVASIPEGLPAVVTIALSIGIKNLLKKNVLVKKLSSVETLGSCNVICTDKTGTLTKNEMTVKYGWGLDFENEISGIGYLPQGNMDGKINSKLYQIGKLCNNSTHYKEKGFWKISGDPTEAALLVSAKKTNLKFEEFERIDEIPFDSNRKLMSVLIKDKNKYQILTKGSCDELVKKCNYIQIDSKIRKITKLDIEKILKQNEIYSKKTLRVLGFAYQDISNKNNFKEKNLIFVGLQAMKDPPRIEVIEAIKKTKIAGIRVIMITGDHEITAKAIAEEIGIFGDSISGNELEKMSIKDIENKLDNNCNIFARVSPEHKLKIITALENQKNIVAMTGDGVNDAPALSKANIGIAVGSGSDVAKDAADFVLLDNSFASIVKAIEEGRGIYDNILKSIMLLLSGNFGEVLIIFFAIILGLNLPLTAIMLLWINLITDGAPALAFSVDPYAKDIIKRKPKKFNDEILSKSKLYLIGFLGFFASIIGLALFYIFSQTSNILAQTMIFNFVILAEIILIFIIKSEFNVELFSNVWMFISIIFSIVLQAIIVYTPLNKLFGIVPLDFIHIIYLIGSGILFYFSYLLYYLINSKFKKIKSFN